MTASNLAAENSATGLKSLKRTTVAFWIVSISMIIGLTWKWSFFAACDGLYEDVVIVDPFFPVFFRTQVILRWAFLGSIGAIAFSTLMPTVLLRRLACGVAFACLTVTCIHQGSYNDMTFVTTWWVSLWCLWFAGRMDDTDETLTLDRAAFLSRAIISVILLGGAAGKWTGEYWSGQVFYEIYFVDRDFWVFNWLRETYEPETLRQIATWYSRKVVLVETLCGFGLWLLPARWAAMVAIVVLTSIALFSNFLLFSVLASLIGLAAVGLFTTHPRPNAIEEI